MPKSFLVKKRTGGDESLDFIFEDPWNPPSSKDMMDVHSKSRHIDVISDQLKEDVNNNHAISRASLSSSPPSCPSSPKSPVSPYYHQPPFPPWYWPHVPEFWYSRFPFYINPHTNERASSKEDDASVLTAAQTLSSMNSIHLKQTSSKKEDNRENEEKQTGSGFVHKQNVDSRLKEQLNSAFERPFSQTTRNSEELKQNLDNLLDIMPSSHCDEKSSNNFDQLRMNDHGFVHPNPNKASGGKSRQFSCKYCDKDYMSLGALKMHIRTHTLPCKCKICGKAFSRPWLLQGHVRTHTGERPFSCDMCGRAFADRSNLRAHLQTHSDVKKYCCQRCGKTFSRMQLLTRHEEIGCYMVM